jgi:hypothetical protein
LASLFLGAHRLDLVLGFAASRIFLIVVISGLRLASAWVKRNFVELRVTSAFDCRAVARPEAEAEGRKKRDRDSSFNTRAGTAADAADTLFICVHLCLSVDSNFETA